MPFLCILTETVRQYLARSSAAAILPVWRVPQIDPDTNPLLSLIPPWYFHLNIAQQIVWVIPQPHSMFIPCMLPSGYTCSSSTCLLLTIAGKHQVASLRNQWSVVTPPPLHPPPPHNPLDQPVEVHYGDINDHTAQSTRAQRDIPRTPEITYLHFHGDTILQSAVDGPRHDLKSDSVIIRSIGTGNCSVTPIHVPSAQWKADVKEVHRGPFDQRLRKANMNCCGGTVSVVWRNMTL